MSEEPRRSVRSTKGFHSHKEQEIEGNVDMPKKKSSKKGGNKKAASSKENSPSQDKNSDGDVIRCICGATSQDGDEPGEEWICCEDCMAWQHNVCMGVSTENVDDLPDYYCELCRPKNHEELLQSIKRGEKLWETRREEYEADKGKNRRKSKGKGGSAKKKKNQVTKATGQHTNGQAQESPVPSARERSISVKKETPAGAKRKARDDSQDQESSKAKQRKVSEASAVTTTPATGRKKSSDFATPVVPPPVTPTTTDQQIPDSATPQDIPKTIADLKDTTRIEIAKHIHKNMEAAFKSASDRGQLTDKSPEALQLTLEVERAIHDSHSKDEYLAKCKLVAINLKRNQELFGKLLSRELGANRLAAMSEDDMKSNKQRREDEEELARAERQSIMVKEDGPRLRRTHKGEELVEDNFGQVPSREQRDPNGDMAVRSRENSPTEMIEPPSDIDQAPRIRQPLNINTQARAHDRKPSIQTAEFDYNKVASKLPTPTIAHPARRASGPAPVAREAINDPDVDRLLQDEPESPPYSPKEDSDPAVIWNGHVEMTSIGNFSASAKHVGGVDLIDLKAGYEEMIGRKLVVTGRIEPDKANEYLCGLRYSPISDMIVISIEPRGEVATEEFTKIFNYFTEKNRYGVVGNRMGPIQVRDIYLVPIEAGNGGIPIFLSNLEVNKLPENRSERAMLLVVVYREEVPSSAVDDGQQSPSLTTHAQRNMGQSLAPKMSPLTHQGSFKPNPPTEQEKQLAGEALALKILGPELYNAPTMAFILPNASVMNPKEWNVMKELLTSDKTARVDLQHLGQLLADKANQTQPQAQASDTEMSNT